jgi:CheY-like chemotaxis protein
MANKKILIVEDDPDVRLGMHVRLKANHYDTFFAGDAFSSVVEARTHEPDLIILDLGLPAGDGFVVMERLKKIPSLAVIPIIVVSARDVRANKDVLSRQGRRPFCKNQRMMPNFWRSSGESWENPRSRRDLPRMTWDPYKREAFLSAPDHPGGVSLDLSGRQGSI